MRGMREIMWKRMLIYIVELVGFGVFASLGRKLHASAEGDTDELVDPPKVEEKYGAVPSGLSTDSDVTKRLTND